jgi:ABC-type dipeptide/oligopeptide/nickel transport system permease component
MHARAFVRFAAKRALYSAGVVLGVITITFVISHLVVPDPARAWAGEKASRATVEAITLKFHLNDPLYIQYYYYLADLLQGNWGISPASGQPVIQSILTYLPATAELTTAALVIIILLGIPLGVIAATHRNKAQDHLARLLSLTGVASPSFVVGLVVQLVFFFYLGIFPDSGGRISSSIAPPPTITGFYTIDSLLTWDIPAFISSVQHLIMPAFSLAFLNLGITSRLVRNAMLESLASDYVRTAKAKGLHRRIVIYKHALKNALVQPITALSVNVAYLLGGAVVIESIFSWPGLGRYAAQAALSLSLPDVMAVTIVFAIGVVLANFVADILAAILDPRIRLR